MSHIDDQLSRRAVLRNATTAVGLIATPALATGCAQPTAQAPTLPKQTKLQAAYQDHPDGSERCGVCAHFIPPGDCRVIQGPVIADGWCRNFKTRV